MLDRRRQTEKKQGVLPHFYEVKKKISNCEDRDKKGFLWGFGGGDAEHDGLEKVIKENDV